MDIGKSFTFMFDDEEWVQKIVIGGLLLLVSVIPLVNLFTGLVLLGYSLRLLQNVARGVERPLPEWNDWGGDWVRGLMVALGSLIYSIPILILTGVTSLIGAVTGGGSYGYDYSRGGGAAASVAVGLLSCLAVIWGILEAIFVPAAVVRYAADEHFGSFFQFTDIFRFIGNNLGSYIVALLLALVAQIVAGFGVILCVIGVFLTSFWSYLVTAHLLGQVGRESDLFPAFVAPVGPITVESGEGTPPPPNEGMNI